ncbi:MAG TPA: hypothetical protein VMV57_12925, partial [Terracidiphilus sp.]|nr:hypothetical protein [Terracidiphilus sp.]
MNRRLVVLVALSLAFGSACAQDAPTDPSQQPQNPGARQQGHRGGPGAWGGNFLGNGRGLTGTVTAVSADNYTLRTETGEVYTVHFSVNTLILKQRIRRQEPGAQPGFQSGAQPGSAPEPGSGPQILKPADIHIGDVIAAGGEVDEAAKSVGAVFVVQLDPERARQMREMEASYGKTWLMGRVIAMDGVKITLEGIRDKASYTFVADKNTAFRLRREPITLADIHLGDMVRADGVRKDGI